MAQRTGSTIYYVELFPEAAARAAGKDPVLALMPVPGEVDIVIASELMEAGRAIQRGLVTPDRTTLIASTHRVYSMTEKTAMGDGRVDADAFLKAGGEAARVFVHRDFAAHGGSESQRDQRRAVRRAGGHRVRCRSSASNSKTRFERSGVAVESSLTAFAAGFDAATMLAKRPRLNRPANQRRSRGQLLQPLAARITSNFPAASHAILFAGIERLADYQDVAYASAYLDRLEPIESFGQQQWRARFGAALLKRRAIWRSGCRTKTRFAWPT